MDVLPKTSRGGSFHSLQTGPYYQATLSCGEGYKLPDIITSNVVNGAWEPPQLDCLPLSDLTELPRTGKGGHVTSESEPPFHIHDKATLECDRGYTDRGDNHFSVIVENGLLKWYPSELHCYSAQCLAPEIENGGIFQRATQTIQKYSFPMYMFGDNIKYTCDIGYKFSNPSHTSFWCAFSGWQPPIHLENLKCVPDTEWCPELKVPDHGSLVLTKGRQFDSEATFSCQKGFMLSVGESKRMCQEDRTWSGKEISCIPPPVCPPMEKDGLIQGKDFFVNDTFNFVRCSDGKIQNLIKVECRNGQWAYKYPYCNKIKTDSLTNSDQENLHKQPIDPAPVDTVNNNLSEQPPLVDKTKSYLPKQSPVKNQPVDNRMNSPSQKPVDIVLNHSFLPQPSVYPLPNESPNSYLRFFIWILLLLLGIFIIFFTLSPVTLVQIL